DDQFALDDLDPVHLQDERVADLLDPVQGPLLLLGAGAVHVQGVEVAEDELDGLEQAAGRLALPRLAEPPAAQRLDEAVAGDRLRVGLPHESHVAILPWGGQCPRLAAYWVGDHHSGREGGYPKVGQGRAIVQSAPAGRPLRSPGPFLLAWPAQ